MKIGILTRNENAWCSSKLRESLRRKNVEPTCFSFSNVAARVGAHPSLAFRGIDLIRDLSAVIVRPIGRGSLDEIVFQLDVLHKLKREGQVVINDPSAIERSVDKYQTLALLIEEGLQVPKTLVTESVSEALAAFNEFDQDAVIKPVFGSRGIGAARVSNSDVAERVFRTLRFYKHVIYIQEYVQHGSRDIRAFVIGDKVAAAMYRISDSWKTNVSRGAAPVPLELSSEVEEIAVKSAGAIGCEIAGVDIMESSRGLLINEINSQPGWRGLQSTTSTDISGKIADYLISKARR